MFIQMAEVDCFLKIWTLTKTAISKWVFNPYRQDLDYWNSRLMKINCIYSRKWFESVYFDDAKQALNDKWSRLFNASCTRRTTKFPASYFSFLFRSLRRDFFLTTRMEIINFNPPLLNNTKYPGKSQLKFRKTIKKCRLFSTNSNWWLWIPKYYKTWLPCKWKVETFK